MNSELKSEILRDQIDSVLQIPGHCGFFNQNIFCSIHYLTSVVIYGPNAASSNMDDVYVLCKQSDVSSPLMERGSGVRAEWRKRFLIFAVVGDEGGGMCVCVRDRDGNV